MTILPFTENSPLIRTFYGDENAWVAIRTLVETPTPEYGFRAFVEFVDNVAFNGIDPTTLPMDAADGNTHALLIVADEQAHMLPDRPLLCLNTTEGWSVRVVARELWGIQNNLSIGNMGASEFVSAANEDGIFRGF